MCSQNGKSVPVGVRLYGSATQGGRKYMEDYYDIKYMSRVDNNELMFVFIAVFDGHGGHVAAQYASQHLCRNIIRQRSFWSSDDNEIMSAINKGFLKTHYDMWREVGDWPKTASGLPSTSGTTASVVFIMNGKYYTGHVGDSRVVLGRKNQTSGKWHSLSLTRDHKPESVREKTRIEAAGGQVVNKSGVDRVVWNRPKLGHKGPIRRSTSFDCIPFLAVARSLGDLWSFNSLLNTFIVSPEPDVRCIPIDPKDTCLLLASDGLWNMMLTQTAVKVIQEVEEERYSPELMEAVFGNGSAQISPSRALVHFCLNRWYQSRFRADNTTVLAVILDHNQGSNQSTIETSLPVNQNINLFNESDDSDDGYDESFDATDIFGDLVDYNKDNDSDVENRSSNHFSANKSLKLNTSVPELFMNKTSSNNNNNTEAHEVNSSNSSKPEAVVNVVNDNNVKPVYDSEVSSTTTDSNDCFESKTEPTVTECDENSNNESSRDSGTASPVDITNNDQLTDEEYEALPQLINLSQNRSEIFVEINEKTVRSESFNFGVCGDNTADKSTANNTITTNNNWNEKTALNNYIYCKSFSQQSYSYQNNNEISITEDNFWSESSNCLNLTSIRPRTSLPMSFGDNQTDSDRTPMSGQIFGALKDCINTNPQNDSKTLSLIFNSNKDKAMSEGVMNRTSRLCIKNKRLFRRLTASVDNKPRISLSPRSATKRRLSSDFSPPSKHLRSSLWTRPLVSREQTIKLNFTRSLKQLAVGRLTRSRLRPMKLLKSFRNST